MAHNYQAPQWSRWLAVAVMLAIFIGMPAFSQTCTLTIASPVQFDTPITWTPSECTSTVQGYESERLVGQVKQIRSGEVTIRQISSGTSTTLGVKLWPLSGPAQPPMEIPVVINDCRTPRFAISSVPSLTTRVCWVLPNCTASVEALQDGVVVSRMNGVKSCEKTIAELTNGVVKPTELRLYATPTAPAPAESRLLEPSNRTPAELRFFQDDFRRNKGWLDFITEEIVRDTCYDTGAGKVELSDDLAPGGPQMLRAEANWRGLNYSNHVIAGNRIVDSGQTGRWIYRFSFYLPSATAGSGQSAPEGSIQNTVDGSHTYIAGVQFQSNPELLPENRDAWAIWMPGAVGGPWMIITHQALVRNRWYTVELEADFESKEYVRFSVTGDGLELKQDLAGKRIAAESRKFDPAFVVTLEVENQSTCETAPRPTRNIVYYRDVELVRLPESDHPYPDNSDNSWSYAVQNATALRVTFDPRTSVENGADFIHVTDGNGLHVPGSPFTGTSLAGQTKTVPGNTVRIRLVTDRRNGDFGFKVTDIAAVVALPPPTGPDLTLSKTHSGTFFEGETGTYSIEVRNIGSGPTSGTVTVVDTLPAGLTASEITGTRWNCLQPAGPCTQADVLAPGSSYPPLKFTVTAGNNAAGVVINSAAVSGGGDTSPDNNRGQDPTTILARQGCAPLESDHPYLNDFDGTWTCTLPNATSLSVTFDPRTSVEAGADFIYVLDGNGVNIPGSPFTGTSLAGQSKTVPGNTVKIRLSADRRNSDFGFRATVAPGPPSIPSPDLTITKTHAGNFTRGKPGVYSIEVRNIGTGITSGAVRVSDTVPAGLTATAFAGTGWSCTQPAGPCTRADALPPGSAYPRLELTVTVGNDAAAVVTNSATVSGGGDTTQSNNTADDQTLIPSSQSCTLPESEHPYGNSFDNTWSCSIPNAAATAVEVRFDPRTSVESGADFIYVMDGNGVNIAGSPFTGTVLAGQSKTVPGNTVKIRLVTDRRNTDFGFKISNIAPWGIAVGDKRTDTIIDAFDSSWNVCCTADDSIPRPVVRIVEGANGNVMEVDYDLTKIAPPESLNHGQSWVVLQRPFVSDLSRFTHLRIALKGSNLNSHDNIEIKLKDSSGLFAVSLISMTDLPVWRAVYIDLRELTGKGAIDLAQIAGLEIGIVRCEDCEVYDNPSIEHPGEEHTGTLSIREFAVVDLKPEGVNRLVESVFEPVQPDPAILSDTSNAILARVVPAGTGAGLTPAWYRERFPNFNTYANAQALLVFIYEYQRTSNAAFRNAARNMAARLLERQIPVGRTQAGAWYTGYGIQNGVLTPPGRNANETCDGNEDRRNVSADIDTCEWVGNVGWVLIALDKLQRSGIYDDSEKLRIALERGLAWVAGQPRYRANPAYPELISLGIEGNISAYFALLAGGRKDDAARLGGAIFKSAWDDVQRRLKPGAEPSSAASAMDVAGSWGVTFLRSIGRVQEALDSQSYAASILRVCSFDGSICGYGDIAGPYTPTVEFTAQAVAAGIKDADFVMREILKLQQRANDPYPGTFPGAADHWFGGQLKPWNTTMPGVAPTAWVYFAAGNRDPLIEILMRQ